MAYFIYRHLMQIVAMVAARAGFINSKLKKRNQGLRTQVVPKYERCIWVHCASLGEFEQGKVLIDELRRRYPQKKLVLTFFSSSGFEKKKNYDLVDTVLYLPYDTIGTMTDFVQRLDPEIVVFVKYEFWFNLLDILSLRDTHFVFVSATFRPDQYLLRPVFSSLLDRILKAKHIFVQNQQSKELLLLHGYSFATVAGDTRIDRVLELKGQNFSWLQVDHWIGSSVSVIAGSTWPKDEKMILEVIPYFDDRKWIIAPHEITPDHVSKLRQELGERAVFLSDIGMDNDLPVEKEVLVIDRIGLLSLLYRYGDVAYVGGGLGAGIHNTLEPAVYGLPLVFGPNYGKFQEAIDFYERGLARVIRSGEELKEALEYFGNLETINKTRVTLDDYFRKGSGATKKIMDTLVKLITDL